MVLWGAVSYGRGTPVPLVVGPLRYSAFTFPSAMAVAMLAFPSAMAVAMAASAASTILENRSHVDLCSDYSAVAFPSAKAAATAASAASARPVHLIITMLKWIRTSRLSIRSLSLPQRHGRGNCHERRERRAHPREHHPPMARGRTT